MARRTNGLLLLRTLGVVGAVAILVSGVTFAALQSQSAVSQGNTITSATASLQISNGQTGFGATSTGYDFTNVEPGGKPAPAPGNTLLLKNNGSSDLSLQVAMDANTLANPNNADLNQVYVLLTPVSGVTNASMQEIPLANLLNAYTANKPLALNMTVAAGQTAQFSVQVQIGASAVTSIQQAVSIRGINLIFDGVSVSA